MIKRTLLALCVALLAGSALAQSQPAIAPTAAPVAGSLPAQASSGSATVGSLGEFVSAQANAESIAATFTNASPTVVTMTANTFGARCVIASTSANKCVLPVYFTGLVGTAGVSNATLYYVDPASVSGNTFKIATSVANAIAGTDVNTTGTDSGTGIAGMYGTSNTPQAVAAINLTAGDWDCSGSTSNNGVTSTLPTIFVTTIANSIATSGVSTGDGSASAITAAFTGGTTTNAFANAPHRFSLSAQSLVYLVMRETWTGGATNPVTAGLLRCRRAE